MSRGQTKTIQELRVQLEECQRALQKARANEAKPSIQAWIDRIVASESRALFFREVLEHAQQNVRALTGGDERRIAGALAADQKDEFKPTEWVKKSALEESQATARTLSDKNAELQAKLAELEKWQLEVADGLGYCERPEGQAGYRVADAGTIIDAFVGHQGDASTFREMVDVAVQILHEGDQQAPRGEVREKVIADALEVLRGES